MATKSATRTLYVLRKRGYTCAISQRWVPFFKKEKGEKYLDERGGIRKDAFGFIDITAIDGINPILAVQACDMSKRVDHIKKILNEPNALEWLRSGGRIELYAWRKLKQKKKDGTFSKVAKYKAKRFEIGQCLACAGRTFSEGIFNYCQHCNKTGMTVEEKSDD